MDSLEITKPAPASPTSLPVATRSATVASCCGAAAFPAADLRAWLTNRRVLAVGGITLAGAGTALGWDWLTAVGIAPLLISAAPCLIM